MKKLLFAFFVLTVVLGSISLQAQDRFSFADDDEMAGRYVCQI